MKKLFLSAFILIVISISLSYAQSPVFYGTSTGGGTDDQGVIFSYNAVTNVATDLYNFGNGTDGFQPEATLIRATDGLLYGMTSDGGVNHYGILFSYSISTGTETDLHGFGAGADGKYAASSVIQASNGLLYGMTEQGGTIFSYDISKGKETVVHSFDYGDDGKVPDGALIQVGDSLLYGMTGNGGVYDGGIIFSFNIYTGVEKDLHDFANGTDGLNPYADLMQASDSKLYGVTTGGGTNGFGILFSYDISAAKETVLHDFGGPGDDGIDPYGSLKQVGDSLLYGTTAYGGLYSNDGVLFTYNIFTGVETVLHNFGNGNDGSNPTGSVIQASNGLLYGTTVNGVVAGTLFSYNVSTSTYTSLIDFNVNDGANPSADLLEVDSITTGNSQLSVNNNQLSIYPNPSCGQFTIKPNSNQNGYTMEVYNVMGEEVYQSVLSNSQNSIDLSSQPAGLYFVCIRSDAGVEVRKVLLKK